MPCRNGQVERLNSVVINMLDKLCIDQLEKFHRPVKKAQMAKNRKVQRPIGMASFKLTFDVDK